MNKTLKGIIGGTVLLALLGGGIAVLKLTEPDESSEESSDSKVVTELWHAHADEINKITVDNPNGDSYSAFRKMEKMESTDMDGNATEEDVANYYLEGYESLPMNTQTIRTLATRSPELSSTDTVQEHAAKDELGKYGLDQPVKVTFSVDNADDITFLIGGETPVDSGRYLMMEGSDTVYTVNASSVDPFLEGIRDYLGTTLLEPQADDDDTIIESVRVERSDLDYDFYFEYDQYYKDNANGGAMAVHVMKEPVEALLSADRSADATNGLFGLTAKEVLTPFPSDAEIKTAGLDDPFVTVTMKTDDNKTRVFKLGGTYENADGDKLYYGMMDGLDCIYGFSPDAIIYDNMKPEDLISRNVIDMYVWDIGKLEAKTDGTDLKFDCTATTQEDAVMKENGKDMDADQIERYRKLYTYLLSTSAEDIVYEEPEVGEPLAELHIERQDGKRTYDIAYYDAGNMKAYIMVNGTVRFTCRKSYVDVLVENLKNFDDAEKELTMTW